MIVCEERKVLRSEIDAVNRKLQKRTDPKTVDTMTIPDLRILRAFLQKQFEEETVC